VTRRLKNLGFLALSSLIAVGCASLGTFQIPELSLVDLQMVDATLFETTLQARLRIANPNPEPVTFDGATFKLNLEGIKVARGASSESVTIARLDTELIDVTFHLNNAAVVFSLRDVLQQEDLSYALRGRLFVQRPFGVRKLKVRRDGRLTLPRQQPAENNG
jgi:LEA14-like dessication related protein